MVPATRFGAKPAHSNTFLNHQPGPNTPGYLDEATRLGGRFHDRGLQTKVDFQAEEKARKQATIESKVAEKRANVERQQAQIAMVAQDQLARGTAKTIQKAALMDNYEKLNHLY